MAVPKIETFEGQITEEIKGKEEVMADLVASSGKADIGRERKNFTFLILGTIIFLIAAAAIGLIFFIEKSKTVTVLEAPPTDSETGLLVGGDSDKKNNQKGEEVSIYSLLPTTSLRIGRFIESAEKSEGGYVLKIKEYAPVVAYLLEDEISFGEEALSLFGGTASGTIIFRDITRSNQDIRIYDATTPGVAYAYVGTTTLLIAPSEEQILKLRNAIIK